MNRLQIVYLIIIFLYINLSLTPSPVSAWESGVQTSIKASIQEKTSIRLIGYTGPNTIVQVEGIRIFAQTSSDRTGYFVIDPLPISYEASEICISTIDSERRNSFPLCIQLPKVDKPTEIGPVYLSPTLSLSTGSVLQTKKAIATGVTIPETKVIVSIFETTKINSLTSLTDRILAGKLIPSAEAADMPSITINSDKKGVFNFNLPTDKALDYRFFVKAIYKNSPTPKSHTLSFRVDSITLYWIMFILPRLLIFIILLGLAYYIIQKETKDSKGKAWLAIFTETKLKPLAVRRRLQLRRIWYNLREYWRSNRI